MHAVSTNQIADILHFNDKKSSNNFLSFADSFMENNAMKPYIKFETYLYNKSKHFWCYSSLKHGKPLSSIYSKPTNAYLNWKSYHPFHIVKNIPKVEFPRLRSTI